MMVKRWWSKTPKASLLEEMIPLLTFIDDHTMITKDGYRVQVIELLGRDYTGMAQGVMDSLFVARKRFIESLPPNIMPSIHSIRYQLGNEIDHTHYHNKIAGEIAKKWSKHFVICYKTRHYVVLRTANPGLLDQLVLNVGKNKKANNYDDDDLSLADAVQNAKSILHDYKPHSLNQTELASFWASHVNGKRVTQTLQNNVTIDSLIAGTGVFWPDGCAHQIHEDVTGDRFSAWLTIKFYSADATAIKMMDDLFRIQRDFTIYQTFQTLDKTAVLNYIEDKEKNVVSFARGGQVQMVELTEAKNRVETGDISFSDYSFALQVFAESLSDLEIAVNQIKNIPESYGFRVAREKLNQEPLFWSIFPGLEKLNVRKRVLSSENIADLGSFASVGEGIEKTTWGEQPVTRFKTLTGSEFAFTFHPSPDSYELGHTLVIGGPNSGKTTLISMLLSQCFKYDNFRALVFDRLHGMEVFTRIMGGEYTDFVSGGELNPLQLPDKSINRTFLASFFGMLVNKSDDETQGVIKEMIDMAYTLSAEDRTLDNLELAFGLKAKDSIRAAMDKWLSGGAYGHFFTSKADALSFKKTLVGFDMTTLLDLPEVLGPLTFYIFHRLMSVVDETPGPHAVFIDEVIKYLESDTFGPEVMMLAREIRKKNGVLIMAVQEASAILDSKRGKKLLDSLATYILFSNPTAEEDHYCNGLGLTKEEYTWIKQPNRRHIMLKRRGGESVILNVDLSALDQYLRVFDSSAQAVAKLRRQVGSGGDWRKAFLHG